MNSKEKGDIAVGKAISFFIKNSYEVCLPVGNKRHYDIVIEKNGKLERVEVKYAGRNKTSHGVKCMASLRITGGNQSFNYARKYNARDFDSLFIYTENQRCYHIPWKLISCTNVLCIECGKYDKFLVE